LCDVIVANIQDTDDGNRDLYHATAAPYPSLEHIGRNSWGLVE
jgi:hypothetical protein